MLASVWPDTVEMFARHATTIMNEYDAKNAAHIHPHVHSHVPEKPAVRVKALETLLIENGLLDSTTVDAWIEVYSDELAPKVGAKVVARAWCDDDFRTRLLTDSAATIKEMNLSGWALGDLKVVENTSDVHNLVVCTLCSCYPHGLLGIQPSWHKLEAYRSWTVLDSSGVLAEFDVSLSDDVRVDL
jgi:nitrile hydratase